MLTAYAFYSLPWLKKYIYPEETYTIGYVVVLAIVFIMAIWYGIQTKKGHIVTLSYANALAVLMGILLSVSATKHGFNYLLYWFTGGYIMLAIAIFCGINAKQDIRPLVVLAFFAYAVGALVFVFMGYEALYNIWFNIFWAVLAFIFAIVEVQDFCFKVTEIEDDEDVDALVHPMTINLFCDLLLFGAVFDVMRIAVKISTFRWLRK